MAQKPSIPKGTRDFSPAEIARRNYITGAIKRQFETFGFQPIETPSFENLETLLGKYGDEGDRLIFKILNSGDFLLNVKSDFFKGYFDIELITYKAITYVTEYINSDEYIKSDEFIESDEIIESDEYIFNFIKNESEYQSHLVKGVLSRLSNEERLQFIRVEYYASLNLFFEKIKNLIEESNYSTGKESNEYLLYGSYNIIKEYQTLYLKHQSKKVDNQIAEKALRYDLTVPFARYVVMHQHELSFPFKRYQIQPVWRADRPQKGRFREFYQCDADVVGAQSLLQEAEFIQLYDTVFADLGLKGVVLKLNHRKVLSGIAEVIGAGEQLASFTVALDKLDKIGREKVEAEMLQKGISQEAIRKAAPLFELRGTTEEQLAGLKALLKHSETGLQGVAELEEILTITEKLGLQTANCQLDITLARGLNYYTGAIFEVAAPEGVDMGSIGGGGRYDDLTGIFGLQGLSGVGISFGLDRIYLVMEELGLFPESLDRSLQVLCVNFGEKEALAAFGLVKQLRKQGIKADLYPAEAKLQKQFKYANSRNVQYVISIGEAELANGTFVVKDMHSGEQQSFSMDDPLKFLNSLKP